MSASALTVTWQAVPILPVLLELVEPKRRPAPERAALVALRLADAFRDSRGWVDETRGQVAAAVGFGQESVGSCLRALDHVGVWTVDTRGRRGVGSKRSPGPILAALRMGVDPHQIAALISGGSDPHQIAAHLVGVDSSSRGGKGLISWGSTPTHPLRTPTNQGVRPKNVRGDFAAGTSAAARALEQRTQRRLDGTACHLCNDTGMILTADGATHCTEDHP